jgi:RNA polymerase sigma-70 factor (ECF subfamily)
MSSMAVMTPGGAADVRRRSTMSRMQAAQRLAERASGGAGAGGAEERMRVLYQIHSDHLVRTFLYWTYGDRQIAEDLMQETMMRAWQNLDKLYRDPALVRPWLMTVARRIAIDMLRARGARPTEVSDDASEWAVSLEAPEPFGRVHDRCVIDAALDGLPKEQRAALLCVYILDQTVPQAARRLGVPEGTVKSRLHYALRALRASLGTEMF